MTSEKKSILFLKYAPSIMAVTCAVKIFLFYHDFPIFCQYINILLNTAIVYGLMKCGEVYGFSKKHNFICWTAIIGYVGYCIILTFDLEHSFLHYLTILYLLFVLIITIIYKKI